MISKPSISFLFAILFTQSVQAQSFETYLSAGSEVNRTQLVSFPIINVVSSIIEIKPGDEFHGRFNNIVSGYVIQGSTIQVPEKGTVILKTGSRVNNFDYIYPAGFKVVGFKSLKMFAVKVDEKYEQANALEK